MQIAFITDQHRGARNDSQLIADYQQAFYDNVFFPEIDKRGITRVFDLGDFFDRRKFINFGTLARTRTDYLDPLVDRGIRIDMLVGNHDIYYRNTNRVNSPLMLLEGYDNIHTYEEPATLEVDGVTFAMIPWINNENYDEVMEFMASLGDDAVICGHFELAGFAMHRGMVNEDGMSSSQFSRFEAVYSGHFHTRSKHGNIHYLGSPFELTWNDYNDPRGFHIYDTQTGEMEFIENPYKMFHQLVYDDSDTGGKTKLTNDLKDSVIKLFVDAKNNPYDFEKYLTAVNEKEPNDVQVIERFSYFSEDLDEEEIEERVKDTPQLIKEYVDSVEASDYTKRQVNDMMKKLYAEALNEA